jgi:hypothetical protein
MALDVAGSLDPREVIARILERGTHAVYLSRGLADQMGGSLNLKSSQPGKGSIFVLRLPAAGP